jgi:hypothetical protein
VIVGGYLGLEGCENAANSDEESQGLNNGKLDKLHLSLEPMI